MRSPQVGTVKVGFCISHRDDHDGERPRQVSLSSVSTSAVKVLGRTHCKNHRTHAQDSRHEQNSTARMSNPLYSDAHGTRRHPLSSNNLHNYRQPFPTSPPRQHAEPLKHAADAAPKPPASPPLPRQNAKVTPPSPPKVIRDVYQQIELTRVGLLGEVRTLSAPLSARKGR